MTVIQSVLLGILQGVAEFLPISSSGHLALAQKLFSLEDVPLLYDVMLHLATLLAVVIFFRQKIGRLFSCLFRWIFRRQPKDFQDSDDILTGSDETGRKTILAIIASTVVTAVIGIFTGKFIPELSIKFTCAGFIVTAALLLFSSWMEKKSELKNSSGDSSENPTGSKKGISIKQGLFIGLMQGFGTLPGISRSGSTIAGAQLAKVNRTQAGEYSFIVSIPAILGAFVLELKDLDKISSSVGFIQVFAGCLAAFVSGYLALSFLMKLIRRGKLQWFAAYLIPLGIAGLLFF